MLAPPLLQNRDVPLSPVQEEIWQRSIRHVCGREKEVPGFRLLGLQPFRSTKLVERSRETNVSRVRCQASIANTTYALFVSLGADW
jgi:hypothetical protein